MSGLGRETGHLSCWMLHLGQLIRAAISQRRYPPVRVTQRSLGCHNNIHFNYAIIQTSANWEAFIAQVINYKIHSFQDLQSLQSCIYYT